MIPTSQLSRRHFLQALAGTAAALYLPGSAPAQQGNYYRPIRYQLHHNFNRTELGLIGQALNLVAHRMLDPRMFTYADANSRYWYVRVPNRNFRNSAEFEAWFTRIQMPALRERGFPLLHLRGQYDTRGSWTGRAPVGTVITDYRRVRYGTSTRLAAHVEGAFDVTLNTALLGSSSFHLGRCPHYWAGVIAHEMLHNLGHEHPVGVYNGTFIRAYERAVWLNADPRRRESCGLPNGCCG